MTSLPTDSRPAEILLVEDNESDVILTREAFKRARLTVNLHHVDNGAECMAFLRREGPYAGAPRPDLMLLDLNMPLMDGREVVAALAADDSLRELPVAILTTSDDDEDIHRASQLPRASRIVKPVDFVQFQRVIKEITDYWLTVMVPTSR